MFSPITTPRRKLEFIRKDRNHTEAQSLKTQLLYGLSHTERANDRINHLCSSFPVVFSKALMTMDSKRNETKAFVVCFIEPGPPPSSVEPCAVVLLRKSIAANSLIRLASVLYLSREWEWQGRPRPSGVGATLLRGPGGAVCVWSCVSLLLSLASHLSPP